MAPGESAGHDADPAAVPGFPGCCSGNPVSISIANDRYALLNEVQKAVERALEMRTSELQPGLLQVVGILADMMDGGGSNTVVAQSVIVHPEAPGMQ